MPHIGMPELLVILVLAFIIFGAGKLPTVGKAIGETIKEIRQHSAPLAAKGDAETGEQREAER